MANLKTMSYKELSKLPEGKRRKLGYETYAENRGKGMVVIYHHNNPIAGIHKDRVELDWCGWNSNTTRDRLDQIIGDNFGYQTVRVSKHDYQGGLNVYQTKVHIPFQQATVYKNGVIRVHR